MTYPHSTLSFFSVLSSCQLSPWISHWCLPSSPLSALSPFICGRISHRYHQNSLFSLKCCQKYFLSLDNHKKTLWEYNTYSYLIISLYFPIHLVQLHYFGSTSPASISCLRLEVTKGRNLVLGFCVQSAQYERFVYNWVFLTIAALLMVASQQGCTFLFGLYKTHWQHPTIWTQSTPH